MKEHEARVLVLLSSYNGEKYIKTMLDSLMAQHGVMLDLLIRDDGSSDSTLDIIDQYRQVHGGIIVIRGKNAGAADSFFKLIETASKRFRDYDYYFLADQDDYWESRKAERAVQFLKKHAGKKYVLYASDVKITDENLHVICYHHVQAYDYKEQMLRSSVSGCTFVMNMDVIDLIAKYHPKQVDMHDAWIVRAVLTAGGKLLIDHNSYILYRQHGNNTAGVSITVFDKFRHKWKRMIHRDHMISKMAAELLEGYGSQADNEKRAVLKALSACDTFKGKMNVLQMYSKYCFSNTLRKIFFIWDVMIGNI